MEDRAQRVAESISKAIENPDSFSSMGYGSGRGMQGKGQGVGRNFPDTFMLRWMNNLLLTDLRVVDKDGSLVQSGQNQTSTLLEDLSDRERTLVEEAFLGNTNSIYTESATNANERVVTAVSPLKDGSGEIIGAVILQESMSVNLSYYQGAQRLFLLSFLVAGIIAIFLAIFSARGFIRPLKTIQTISQSLIKGDYQVATCIEHKDEIGELAKNIDLLALRLKESQLESKALDQLRDDFISSMSHELKTPVTVMKASLEALHVGLINKPEQVAQYHEILYRESQVLEKLIQDLSDLNVLKNPKFSVKNEECNLLEILQDAIRSQNLLAKEKSIRLKTVFHSQGIFFQGDYTRLRQMFITVLNNAIKYAPAGSSVLLQEENLSGKGCLSIVNYGNPISKEAQEHIFEPFYRDKNLKEEGFGLGLAIAQEIAKHHNMKILLESNRQHTKFTFQWEK